MNYQSGDKLKNRYLSSDAFTSLTNKLGGRSIISLGNRRKGSYKIPNQGMSLFDYKNIIYKTFITVLLLIIVSYIIPQTRYFVHGFFSKQKDNNNEIQIENISYGDINIDNVYNIAPVFLKTDRFITKQKDLYIDNGVFVYDFISNNLIGVTDENTDSTINIKLFSDAGFKNNFLIEKDLENSSSSEMYDSYVFEGLGYGQLIAKVPPQTVFKKDSFVYIRTVDGLQPFAKIINVDEDNKSTFTIIYAQLLVSPQNTYKVFFK